MPNRADLRLLRGDDYTTAVAVLADDGYTPADLTGYVAQSEIRPSYASANVAAEFAASIDQDTITLELTHDQTEALVGALYVWDLQITDSLGTVTTLLTGQVVVRSEVTLGGPSGGVAAAYTHLYDYDTYNFPIYEGWAVPGSATSAAAWAIRRFTWSGGLMVRSDWADGNASFDNVWDNRASLTYL